MRLCPVARRRRGGVTIVEAALLLSIFLLFLFGVFEYARLLMLLQVGTNAARSGARHATVNVDKSATFVTVDEGGVLLTLGVASYFPAEFGIAKGVDAQSPAQGFYAPGPYVNSEILIPTHPTMFGYAQKTLHRRIIVAYAVV